jgi:hypothetical protein
MRDLATKAPWLSFSIRPVIGSATKAGERDGSYVTKAPW